MVWKSLIVGSRCMATGVSFPRIAWRPFHFHQGSRICCVHSGPFCLPLFSLYSYGVFLRIFASDWSSNHQVAYQTTDQEEVLHVASVGDMEE